MTKEQRGIRRHFRNPAIRNWVKQNEAWFKANPTTLHSLLNNPQVLNVLGAHMESNKEKISRRLARAERRAGSAKGNSAPAATKRKPLLRLPKLSLSNLNLETATEKLSRAAEVMDTIRNITGMLGK